MHYTLLYISRITSGPDEVMLSTIQEQSSAFNRAASVTGLLLWSKAHFCQILQGPKISVEDTMQRIARDERHLEPLVLLRTYLAEALFPDWSMAFSQVEDPAIANQIGLAYQDRLADLALVDGIVELMQRFRLHRRFDALPVVVHSHLDELLAVLALSDSSDQMIEHLLQVGSAMFNGNALLLILRAPGSGRFYLKTCASIDEINAKSVAQHLTDERIDTVAEYIDTAASSSTSQLRIEMLAHATAYHSATGCVIRSIPRAESSSGDPDVQQNADRCGVIGTLWVLFQHDPAENREHLIGDKLVKLGVSMESSLAQKYRTFSKELLRQESRRRQLSIAASQRRQEMVLNVASSAILALDRSCRVLMINNTAQEMFDQTGMTVPYLWPSSIVFLDPWALEPLPQQNCPVQLAAKGAGIAGNSVGIGIDTKAKSGSIVALQINETTPLRYLKVTNSMIDDPDSAISGVVVFDDITELQHNRELVRRSDRLDALGHLTGGIAHDFNNLLSTIQSSVELAGLEADSASRRIFLDIALDSVQRGADLTDKLVTFAVARPVRAQVHKLKEIMRSVADLAMTSIEQDVKFVLEEVPDSLFATCDAGQLENALLNILINSRDAILESGTGDQVSIAVQPCLPEGQAKCTGSAAHEFEHASTVSPGKIHISITDNGPGMTAEVMRRATDPFFSTKAASSGSGLGLSMVYRFVEQSDGELLIENLADRQPGTTGARVTVVLNQASRALTPQSTTNPAPRTLGNHTTVLVAEDEINLATMLEQTLQRCGLHTRVAYSGEVALEILQSDKTIDLLLTDIVLTGSDIDGYALATEATRLLPDLKVVYLSGYPLQTGGSNVTTFGPLISKPVSRQQLIEVIHEELGQAASQEADSLVMPN